MQHNSTQDKVGQEYTTQNNTRRDQTRRHKTTQEETRQENTKTTQEETRRQDKPRPRQCNHKTRPSQSKPRQGKARQDRTGQDNETGMNTTKTKTKTKTKNISFVQNGITVYFISNQNQRLALTINQPNHHQAAHCTLFCPLVFHEAKKGVKEREQRFARMIPVCWLVGVGYFIQLYWR
jgi:hypothetical protein